MAKSKSAKKKNNVSKHILKSREDDPTTASDVGDKSYNSPKKIKSKSKHTKHPEEAAFYLSQWKASKSDDSSIRASSSWKFNKNTQSWLIRHLYEVDKVPKSTFLLLLDYLDGLEGKFIIDRMRMDALRRCRRHKEYCKSNELASTTESRNEPTEKTENSNDINEENGELEYEEALWRKMDDHEKRKQYKRARKILDMMKKGSEDKID